ncbi:hypothetical protein M7775_12950, partial [Sporomusa sphaeroides DSM 2875]|nr:hypothetical protein [Sporomusa sphaeroides DSM 2875]
GLMAKLGGGSFASGAAGAAFNQIVINELANIKDPALMQWASAVLGAAAAKVVGGNAQTGASTAVSETKNNYLSHWQKEEKKRQLAECATDEERRNIEKYWDSVDIVQDAIMSAKGYTPQDLKNNDNLMQEVAARAQEILSNPNATPGDYGNFKITPAGELLVLVAGAYIAISFDWKTFTLGSSVYASGSKVNIQNSQIGKKLVDHAADYGLALSKEGAATYRNITQKVLQNATEVRVGNWKTLGECEFYINGADVAIVKNGEWVSTFPLTNPGTVEYIKSLVVK